MPYASKICFILPLWMESKALVKSTNSIVTGSIFAHMPSRILRIVNICEVVDLFLQKPFWFFLRMLLTHTHIYIYIYIYLFIIIKTCWQHRLPLLTLTIYPYHQLLLLSLLKRNSILFYQIGQIFVWLIICQLHSVPLLGVYWHHFQ